MQDYFQPKSKFTRGQLAEFAFRFQLLREKPEGLATIVGLSPEKLDQLLNAPASYSTFKIPKPGGQKRLIHAPGPALKSAQGQLNLHLQACYYFLKPAASHGFILCPADDPSPRNAYTNALTHVAGQFFLNIDLKDFFHFITARHLHAMFKQVFGFPDSLILKLMRLTTFQQVLPMGAPTSPVLSNLVLLPTDRFLLGLSKLHHGKYSRFADDLTFSFSQKMGDGFLPLVRQHFEAQGFELNDQKTRAQMRLDQPEVTGLVIARAQKPVLSATFLKKLKKEIKVYRYLVSEAVRSRELFPSWIFDQFRRSVAGQLEFAGMVLGRDDRVFRKLAGEFHFG